MGKGLVVLGLLALTACSHIVYTNPNYTPELWAKDRYECERDARQSGYFGTGIYGALQMQGFFDRCMEARGWTKTRQ